MLNVCHKPRSDELDVCHLGPVALAVHRPGDPGEILQLIRVTLGRQLEEVLHQLFVKHPLVGLAATEVVPALGEDYHAVDEAAHRRCPGVSGLDAAMAHNLRGEVPHHVLAALIRAAAELRDYALLATFGHSQSGSPLDAVVHRPIVLRPMNRGGVLLYGAAAIAFPVEE